MATSLDAYVDTSAFIAFGDRSDSHHHLFARLFANPPRLVTTSLVVGEGHGWFLRRYDRRRALQFLVMIEEMRPLTIIAVGAKEQIGGITLLRKFSDQDLTLVDAVGLHLMRERKIKMCWSTNFHLGLTDVSLATETN